MDQSPVAVYVHTPFCPSKCGYCDFNSYAMTGEIIDRTVAATEAEIRRSPWAGRPAKTIFFGGGTPTFLTAPQLCGLLRAVIETHPPIENCEITSEANPGVVDWPKFAAMREAGFNRVSLGAQSFVKEDLIRLGRVHAADEVGRAVLSARQAGFDNLNLDLMFALPGQSMAAWQRNLEAALSLKPEHLSLYCLTIEPNTRYYRLHLKGMLDLPNDEAQVRMYDLALQMAGDHGYEQYEISNFAKPGRQCEHNRCYWLGEEYLAYGPGAVGAIGPVESRCRYTNTKHPQLYCERVEAGSELACDEETLGLGEHRTERIMLGLRLNEGIELAPYAPDPQGLQTVESRGWLEWAGKNARLTPTGRHFCSEVVAELI